MDDTRLAQSGEAAQDENWGQNHDSFIRTAESNQRRWEIANWAQSTAKIGPAMTGDFFIIDSRTWGEVCRFGTNPACAYLVLARGSQADNRRTSWSINAVKQYTGVGVVRAQQAVQSLCDALFIQRIKSGMKPQYVIMGWQELQNLRAGRALAAHCLSPLEHRIYESIAKGTQPSTFNQQEIADKLVRNGVLYRDGRAYVAERTELSEETSPHLIWLPNELVTGTVDGEASPVARVRRNGDVMALRLLIDLYHDQNLRDDGGISRAVLMQEFRRDQVGKVQQFSIFAFTPGNCSARDTGAAACHFGAADGSAFFPRLSILQNCGLIDFVPHLCESPSPDAEIIHPCGLDWTPDGLLEDENKVGWEANEAGKAMADFPKYVEAAMKGAKLFIPVKGYPYAQVVGVARMRYRPRTWRTIKWQDENAAGLPTHIERYAALRRDAECRRNRVPAGGR